MCNDAKKIVTQPVLLLQAFKRSLMVPAHVVLALGLAFQVYILVLLMYGYFTLA